MANRIFKAALAAALSLALTACNAQKGSADAKSTPEQGAAISQIPGNERVESFSQAKRILLSRVFYDHKVTLYCSAPFTADKQVQLPAGFVAEKSKSREKRIEWEHIVPAENFGRAFSEWRDGAPACTNSHGSFKGRKCADLASREYRLMQADFYNLYPAIGAVNAARKNYPFTALPASTPSTFGSCPMKIQDGRAEPPDAVKGLVARTHLYRQAAYPKFRLSSQQQKLMEAWDRMYPATDWECLRAERIQALQGNENPFTTRSCARRGAARR